MNRLSSLMSHPKSAPLPAVRGREALLLLVVLVAASLVYGNALHNGFVMDDVFLIRENILIRKLTNAWQILLHEYRPLRTLSYAIDYYFWGLNPVGYHVTNILLHILSCMMVYAVTGRLTKDFRVSFVTALLYAVHPVHTDAVTYMSGRRDVLFAFFYLAAFYFFLVHRSSGNLRFLIPFFGCYVLSLLSKEMAASLPFLLFGYDLIHRFESKYSLGQVAYFVDLGGCVRHIWNSHKRFYMFLLIFTAASLYYYVILRTASLMVGVGHIEWWGGDIFTNIMTVGYILVYYIKKSFFPVVLVADNHAFPLVNSLMDGRVVLSLMVLSTLSVLFLSWIKRKKLYAFSLFIFFVTLLPVMHIIPHHDLVSEHYLYLPSYGFCMFMGLTIVSLGNRSRKALAAPLLVFLIVFFFSVRTIERNRDWTNEIAISHKDLTVYPENKKVQLVLGKAYLDAFLYDEAMEALNKAAVGEDVFQEAFVYKSYIHYKRGDLASAFEQARRALEIGESNLGHYLIGEYYESDGDVGRATTHFKKVGPGKHFLPAKTHLFRIYQAQWNQSKADEAAEAIIAKSEEYLRLSPPDPKIVRNLARCYEWLLQFEEAIRVYAMLKVLEPGMVEAVAARIEALEEERSQYGRALQLVERNENDIGGSHILAEIAYRVGRFSDALARLNVMLSNFPSRAEVYYTRARVYAKKNDLRNATDDMLRSIRLEEGNPEYHRFLGLLYAKALDFDRAVAACSRAEELGTDNNMFENECKKAVSYGMRYREVSSGDPDRADLVEIYLAYEHEKKAAALLKKLEKSAEESPEMLRRIGEFYERMGREYLGEAIRIYQKILRLAPDDADAYRRLGYIYWKRVHELPAVIAYFSKSLALDPFQTNAGEMRETIESLKQMYADFSGRVGMEGAKWIR